MDKLDWNHVNPATGPVYIEGAKPGDILRVDLLEVRVGQQASMVTIPGEGALGDVITQMETAILKVEGNEIVFKDRLRIPKKPDDRRDRRGAGIRVRAQWHPGSARRQPGLHADVRRATAFISPSVWKAPCSGPAISTPPWAMARSWSAGQRSLASCAFRAEVVDLHGLPTPFVEITRRGGNDLFGSHH